MGYPSKCTVLALLCFSLFLACKKQEPEKAETVVIPEAVDLGLSVKWASFDVGATQPGEIGKYYSWGEIEPRFTYHNWKNYLWCEGSNTKLTKYNYNASYGDNPDFRIALKPEDDVAHILYGGDWHIPTADQIRELVESPFIRLSLERNGKAASMKLTSTKTGLCILIPFGGLCYDTIVPMEENKGGYFWSSVIDYDSRPNQSISTPDRAGTLCVWIDGLSSTAFLPLSFSNMPRSIGMNIRAVYDPGSNGESR